MISSLNKKQHVGTYLGLKSSLIVFIFWFEICYNFSIIYLPAFICYKLLRIGLGNAYNIVNSVCYTNESQ